MDIFEFKALQTNNFRTTWFSFTLWNQLGQKKGLTFKASTRPISLWWIERLQNTVDVAAKTPLKLHISLTWQQRTSAQSAHTQVGHEEITVTNSASDQMWNMVTVCSAVSQLWRLIMARKEFLQNTIMSQWSWTFGVLMSSLYSIRHVCDIL